MTDLPFRKILGLNQQTYQRLRLALSLNLRRQIFVAVCDDLELRDRLAARLIEDLTPVAKPQDGQGQKQAIATPRYPRLITLSLSLTDPNPIAQMAQWISQSPPPQNGNRRAPVPAFQFVGIEQLTREPSAIQRLFLTHLQGIERNLSILESSLILWMPHPWLHALPSSAPDFWQCRTAVFEFVGDPTPLPSAAPVSSQPVPQTSAIAPAHSNPQEDTDTQDEATALVLQNPSQDKLWKLLTDELAELEQVGAETQSEDNLQQADALVIQTPALQAKAVRPAAQATVAATTIPSAKVADAPAIAVKTKTTTPARSRTQSPPAVRATPPTQNGSQAQTPIPKTNPLPATGLTDTLDLMSDGLPTDPVLLLQQIEVLHQEQAPPAALAEAYRVLGNLYRDRIEQGEASPKNLTTAIQAYEQVLVWLHETSDWWTDILNDLGNLYWMLSRYASSPDQALAHLQQGIQAYQLALTKLNFQQQPNAYPMIQNNLGAAYADLARYQDPVENLQRSIQSYQQALRHRKADQDPLRYASTQNNLGTAYWNLAQHQQPEIYLKQAIAAYSEALHYYNSDQEPLSYAMIQNNLGTAYWNLAQHERPQDWLRLALGAYNIALQYRTLDTAPVAYAATQNNLGTAYWHLANHSKDDPIQRTEYLQAAIAAYEATLIATERLANSPQPAPLNFDLLATHNNLALAHHQLASDPKIALEASAISVHLENALRHHLRALEGWQQKPDFRQTALNCVIQVMRTIYNTGGLAGQNMALSLVPGHLLPEILPKLG